jgi:hypothetical protein
MEKQTFWIGTLFGIAIGLIIYLVADVRCHRQFIFQNGYDPHHHKCCVIEEIDWR